MIVDHRGPSRRHPPAPRVGVGLPSAALVLTLLVTAWGVGTLLASWTAAALCAGVGLAMWWRWLPTAAEVADQRRAADALRHRRDPGPSHRDAVDRVARDLLARPASDLWGPAAVLAGLAVACGVAAVLRADVLVAAPVLPLLVAAASVVVAGHRELLRASRWLDAPQAVREEQA
ncbi:hypothetical protein [Modestobacter italicus]|uniref:hypothetical protein n=1 Tax=Modestobacter italicus (strain DSM 44449 / CECT 9708 / BC 501) TaxID=2732864 RepID=UPI001C95A160|nr:hypothetical protein [Modestobacter italicus]